MISKEERERRMTLFRAERDARLDRLDYPGTWTERQKRDYEIRGRLLDVVPRLYAGFAQFVNLEREIAAVETDRDFLLDCRTTHMTELRAMGEPHGGRALGRFQNLSMSVDYIEGRFNPDAGYSLATLELGKLFLAAGRGAHYPGEQFPRISWPGSLPTLEEKLKHLREKLELAQDACAQFEQIPVQEPVLS